MIEKNITPTVETTGSYSVNQQQAQPMRTLPHDYESALEALLTEVRKIKALQAELDETKALLAEERKYYGMLSDAVDEFVRDNARVNDKKGASDLGTASAESKECEEAWMTAREWCLEHQLPVYVKELKWIVSDRLTDICITFPEREQWRLDSVGTRWFPKWACNILDRMYDNDDTFLSEYRTE